MSGRVTEAQLQNKEAELEQVIQELIQTIKTTPREQPTDIGINYVCLFSGFKGCQLEC